MLFLPNLSCSFFSCIFFEFLLYLSKSFRKKVLSKKILINKTEKPTLLRHILILSRKDFTGEERREVKLYQSEGMFGESALFTRKIR